MNIRCFFREKYARNQKKRYDKRRQRVSNRYVHRLILKEKYGDNYGIDFIAISAIIIVNIRAAILFYEVKDTPHLIMAAINSIVYSVIFILYIRR